MEANTANVYLPRFRRVPVAMAVTFAIAYVSNPAAAQSTLKIGEIQGIGHLSPFTGSTQATTGVVTAVTTNGFWVQDVVPDTDLRTSDGIFVFRSTLSKPLVGDTISVNGRIDEFRAGSPPNPDNLTITQINASGTLGAWTRISSGAALPAPLTIGSGGRLPPTGSIAPNVGNVETGGYTLNPTTHSMDFYESLEGMRVTMPSAIAVGPNAQFGEIPVISSDQANALPRTARGGLAIQSGNFNPHRLIVDDRLTPTPVANVGDTLNNIVGVMDYSFENYKLQVTTSPTLVSAGLLRETTSAAPGQIGIASYNVLNLGGNASQQRVDDIAGQIRNNLGAPSIIALQEIQDNNGTTNNGTVAAEVTLNRLTTSIASNGGPSYQWINVNPANNADGGAPGGNIRPAFLYDPARVSFSGVVGGTLDSVSVNSDGTLSPAAGRVDPNNVAWTDSRKPLVAQFEVDGNEIILINNHLNSKGPDQPLFGPNQAPTRSSEVQRLEQTEALASFVEQILGANPNANIVVLGDLNDFEFATTLSPLESAGLVNLTKRLPEDQRYTYNFEGNSQALDHMFVSANLATKGGLVYDIVHANSEFASQISDHDPLHLSLLVPAPVPEPETWLLMGLGGLLVVCRRRLLPRNRT